MPATNLQVKQYEGIEGFGITAGRGRWYAWTYKTREDAQQIADKIQARGEYAIRVNVIRSKPVGPAQESSLRPLLKDRLVDRDRHTQEELALGEFLYRVFPDMRDLRGHLMVAHFEFFRTCHDGMTYEHLARKILRELTWKTFENELWRRYNRKLLSLGETCPCCGRDEGGVRQ